MRTPYTIEQALEELKTPHEIGEDGEIVVAAEDRQEAEDKILAFIREAEGDEGVLAFDKHNIGMSRLRVTTDKEWAESDITPSEREDWLIDNESDSPVLVWHYHRP